MNNEDSNTISPTEDKCHQHDVSIPYTLDIQAEDDITIDILRLYQDLLPSKDSHDRRIRFVKKMEKLLNHEWPNHDIRAHVFGSSVNDLGTTTSDVDLCITTPWTGLPNVRILAKLFRRCGMQHVVCVPRAKVPIVRLFDPELQLSCDINVNNTLALQNTKMIKNYVGLDPRVRPLIMVIKHWTKQRSLNDAANGGTLSSYTWTCMIINFLQQRYPPVLPILHQMDNENKDEDYFCDDIDTLRRYRSTNRESLGGLLFSFFRRFALEFDYDDHVVSVRHGCYLTKAEKGWDTGRNKMSLCVEEPFNVARNLGNSADVSSVLGLRVEFQRVLDLLLSGADLHTICSPYHSKKKTNEIPADNSNNNTSILSLTLPSENRASFFLPIYPYSPDDSTAHPHDRRRSMVDGICSYHTPVDSPTQKNDQPWNYYYGDYPTLFHPRFSSNQALDNILKVRKTRHGSHPLPTVPSTLLSMFNINTNHGTNRSVDNIFARYLKRSTPQRSEGSGVNKGYNMNRRKRLNNGNNPVQERKSYRKSSGMDWPSISSSTPVTMPTPIPTVKEYTPMSDGNMQRSRRWSTPKQLQLENQGEPRKKTLAEIVKVGTLTSNKPSIPTTKASLSTASTTSSNDSKSSQTKNRKNKNSKGNTASTLNAGNKQKKKKNMKS
ncbi:hypothetical protein BDB01DRAFT_830761 [Pilobolus umbonatus]|nr:hypothetical protein BDB01DRAFT_830761 [Pilobolus umbonatus]